LLQSNLYIAFEAISVGQLWLLDSDVLAIAMMFGRLEKILNELELFVPVTQMSGLRVNQELAHPMGVTRLGSLKYSL